MGKELYLLRKQLAKMSPEDSLKKVNWALSEAYKIAVRIRGINDWTNDFKLEAERTKAQREVEFYQLKIAQMILGVSK